MTNVTEIKIGGFGGQGVVMAGLLVGQAAALHDNKFATMTQSFGPEARGSACSSQVIVSDSKVLYPYVTKPDVLVTMNQDAYQRFAPGMKQSESALLLYEGELVKLGDAHGQARACGIPATRFAEELGKKMVLNIVMLGFFTAMTRLLTPEAVRRAIAEVVPRGTEKLNLAAFEKGYAYGLEQN